MIINVYNCKKELADFKLVLLHNKCFSVLSLVLQHPMKQKRQKQTKNRNNPFLIQCQVSANSSETAHLMFLTSAKKRTYRTTKICYKFDRNI